MNKLFLRPNSSGYAVSPQSEVVSTELDGGMSRSRRDKLGMPSLVNVAWMLDEQGFEYLNAFFFTVLKSGTLPFLCDLLLDHPALTEHTCKFVPGSFKPISNTSAFIFNATAQLEVKPNPRDEAADILLVAYYEASGGGSFDLAGALARLATVTIPANFQ